MTDTRVPFDDLVQMLAAIFLRQGLPEHIAGILAANCAACQRDGALSHGVFRIPGYVSTISSGWGQPEAMPVIDPGDGALIGVDARGGFAQVALDHARALLLDRVRAQGIAALSIRHSQHFSALWPDVEPFAESGLVALSVVNSMAVVAPAPGAAPVFGTNPMGFSCPRDGQPPYTWDQAASALAHGDVQIAAREGHMLPADAGVDAHGQPTGDPAKILDGGALLPFGGHKGASIAMTIEILAAAFTGGAFSAEVDWTDHPGARIPLTGQFLLVMDPSRGGTGFAARVAQLSDTVRAAGQQRLPGDRRHRIRADAQARGVALSPDDLTMLNSYL
ncbi:lactate dehydrogenase [Salipiger aestuarii]|uniref:Ldh family oxidoreductase n=1 Tax=Salipiger aestuarii TaxID=568098 RepID=UPI00025B64AE|nr:Ldh family oxidoreductase [Salipiger aestuarii]EIE50715.1 putative dehydrogenase [Citreicella sp. 357]KAA8605018.1 lactate dehydrogenase [Salipiger aestuarii]KAA8608997.1 lactate dehydrogenase [Salipiger aestuarii]